MEDNNFKDALDKANELVDFDFTGNDKFDLDGYYSAIVKIANKNSNIKNDEAEEVVKTLGSEYLDEDYITELKAKEENIKDFFRKYDPNSDLIKSMIGGNYTTSTPVDKLYPISNYLINSYISYAGDMLFTFKMSKKEFKYIDKVLTTKNEYNSDDVFNYVDLMESFWSDARKKVNLEGHVEDFEFKINIKKILILHHLIKDNKVKGKGDEFMYFKSVLYKIAQSNKLFNAFSIISERIKNDAQLWGTALDEVFMKNESVAPQPKTTVTEATNADLGVE